MQATEFEYMPENTRLLFFAGAARDGSTNKQLARCGAAIAAARGHPATFADLGDYPMPLYDGDLEARDGVPDNARKLTALMDAHQGIFIASPEYNASITPLLKNALDWVSRVADDAGVRGQVYRTRIFALGAASPGALGGMRGLIHVRTVMELGLGAIVLPDMMSVPHAGNAFTTDGTLTDVASQQRFETVVQKLAHAARLMRSDTPAT
jgi:chromate reductase, NAD(P)H dehydrogenase (quinone)